MELIPIIEYSLVAFIAILIVVVLFSYLSFKLNGDKEDKSMPAVKTVPAVNYTRTNFQEKINYPTYHYEVSPSYGNQNYQSVGDYNNNSNIERTDTFSNSTKEITKRFTLLNETNTGLPVVEANKPNFHIQSQGSASFQNRVVLFK